MKNNYKFRYRNSFTESQEKQVLSLFYRTVLRPGEIIIKNSDSTIAKELGYAKSSVTHFLSKHLKAKIKALNSRINLIK